MMARRGVLGVLGIGAAAILSGCGLLGGRKSYRFRMTVEVDTPQGIKSGSSVMEITSYKNLKLTAQEHEGGGGLSGEAVVVDTDSGPLFVLLQVEKGGQSLGVSVTRALAPDAKLNLVDDYVATVGKLGGMFGSAKAELPRATWPQMVRFGDIANPKSVETVDPDAFGVKRIMVETTSDEVTIEIEKRIPWLQAAENFIYQGTPYGEIYPVPAMSFRNAVK